jgi:hypothetical protein
MGLAKLRNLLAISTLVAACMGCTTTTTVEPFYRPAGAQVEQVYVSPSADFGTYTKLMARPLEIYYPDNAPAPSQEDLDRMRQIFRQAFIDEIAGNYEVVAESGPDVMLVLAQIVDLKILGPQGTFEPSGRLREVVSSGQLTLLMEFQDSESGRVLARAGEADEGTATDGGGVEAGWAQVEVAARRWAGVLRRFLDANLG